MSSSSIVHPVVPTIPITATFIRNVVLLTSEEDCKSAANILIKARYREVGKLKDLNEGDLIERGIKPRIANALKRYQYLKEESGEMDRYYILCIIM